MKTNSMCVSPAFNGTLRFRELTPIVNNTVQQVVKDKKIDTNDILSISELIINAEGFARELGFSNNHKNFESFRNSLKKYAVIILKTGEQFRSLVSKESVEKAYNQVLNNNQEVEL